MENFYDDFFKEIKSIDLSNTKYWLFRAGRHAVHFEKFYNANEIGLGWDALDTRAQLSDRVIIEEEIKRLYKEEKKSGLAASKIYKFIYEMKVNDIVVMPDIEKKQIAIGRIIEEDYTIRDIPKQQQFPEIENDFDNILELVADKGVPNKFRKVEWIKKIPKKEISPKLEVFLFSPHSISALSQEIVYEIYSSIHDIFIMGEKIHIKYKVQSKESIYANDIALFFQLINYSEKILNIIEPNSGKIEVKANFESPGEIMAIGISSTAILTVLAYILIGGETKINLGKKFSFEIGKGKGVLDYLKQRNKSKYESAEQSHRHEMEKKEEENKQIENLTRLLEEIDNKFPPEQIAEMKKNLVLKAPKELEQNTDNSVLQKNTTKKRGKDLGR